MKVCTYNVNSIRARKELVLSWLSKRDDVDVLCLQELKGEEETFPYQDFEEAGFFCSVYGEKRYNGVASCIKGEFSQVSYGFDDEDWDRQRRLLSVQLGELTILNLYVPHGGERSDDKYTYKMGWYRRLGEYLEERFTPHDSLILVGDFNVAYDDIDVHDPALLADRVGTMAEEREAFKSLLDWGLFDTFRYLYPEEQSFTWWDYRGGAIWKNEGMRIDYILCTEPLLDVLVSVEIDTKPRRRRKPTPSDHTPVIATFDL